jgi:hypothetical protein
MSTVASVPSPALFFAHGLPVLETIVVASKP